MRAAVVLALVLAAPAHAGEFAPLNRPGPKPTATRAQLRASLTCSGSLRHAKRRPVLLTPATTVTSQENFGWNYEPYLKQLGIPWCASDLAGPTAGQNMGDIQERGQYVAYALRTMHRRAKRRISILGHSQGGMVMRWTLRFWPGTRRLVDDVIGMAATNHGSVVVRGLCDPSCAPALWQQRDDARFYEALNSGRETFKGISYTEIFSRTDEFVQPNLDETGTSSLRTGPGDITNVAIQDVCSSDTAEHLEIGTVDPTTAALVMDALTHRGPADPTRIDPAVCSEDLMPGADPSTARTTLAATSVRVAHELARTDIRTDAEPPLACYALAAGCGRLTRPSRRSP